jgi:hypothetical protein
MGVLKESCGRAGSSNFDYLVYQELNQSENVLTNQTAVRIDSTRVTVISVSC